jgi:hypothetical protein
MSRHTLRSVLFVLLVVGIGAPLWSAEVDYKPPKQVDVLPVFLVPRGEKPPGKEESILLMRHLEWSQKRYRELLGTTFEIAQKRPAIVRAKRPLAEYRQLDKSQPAGAWLAELLERDKLNRFNCPHVYLVVVSNDRNEWPVGGARPINGGVNTGGGIIVISTYAMTKLPNFQSTLQHELAHALGLLHVDAYGYDMETNESIMAYNKRHHTNGLQPAKTPGIFISEDLRALALNDRALPNFDFAPARHIPAGYSIKPRVRMLHPMKIPGQPDYDIEVTTESGEDYGSKAANVVLKPIRLSAGPGITFDPQTMWESRVLESGWASVELTFPLPVELTNIAVHSQHSGMYHAAEQVRIQVERDGKWQDVADAPLPSVDATVAFPKAKGAKWKLHFKAGSSRKILIRGLQFFSGNDEIFPPFVPYREDPDAT